MARPLIDAKFHDTYYFVSCIDDILSDLGSHLQLMNEFSCDGQHFTHSQPFPPFSAFHCFLEYVIRHLLTEDTEQLDLPQRQAMFESFKDMPEELDDLDPCTLPIEEALKSYGLNFTVFTDWLSRRGKSFGEADRDDIDDYLDDLRLGEAFDTLLTQSVREAFFILFGNRRLLLNFNHMMAQEFKLHADEAIPAEYSTRFTRPGVLKRAPVPKWARRAVYFRDGGRCVACAADLSGLTSPWAEEHLDHVVPLSAGGLNDVTNLQLLCGPCNREKGNRRIITSSSYEDWYPFKRRDV
jgi:hypothetical protein